MERNCDLLVVDDDPVIRQLLCDVFDDPTYRVLEAESADAARGILEHETPDLVLLDIGLPGEDGLSLARYIREHHDIPIIIVSGAGDPIDRIVGLEIGADDYLVKPFEPRELVARVRTVLRRYHRDGRRLVADDGTEAALRASEASYRPIFESAEDPILVHDIETGAIVDVNRKACEAFGYSREELLQIDCGENHRPARAPGTGGPDSRKP